MFLSYWIKFTLSLKSFIPIPLLFPELIAQYRNGFPADWMEAVEVEDAG